MLPVQHHLQRATQLAVAAVTIQSDDQLKWLGAESADSTWRLPVLDETLLVDLSSERVATEPGWTWTTLAHSHATLPGDRIAPDWLPPEITFADLATARSYAKVTGSGPSRDWANGGRRYSTVVCRGDDWVGVDSGG